MNSLFAALLALLSTGNPNEAASGNETSSALREQASTRVALVALPNDASMPLDAHEAKPQTGSSLGVVLCPAYPGDPPWRPMTCFILSRLGQPWDRPAWKEVGG